MAAVSGAKKSSSSSFSFSSSSFSSSSSRMEGEERDRVVAGVDEEAVVGVGVGVGVRVRASFMGLLWSKWSMLILQELWMHLRIRVFLCVAPPALCLSTDGDAAVSLDTL